MPGLAGFFVGKFLTITFNQCPGRFTTKPGIVLVIFRRTRTPIRKLIEPSIHDATQTHASRLVLSRWRHEFSTIDAAHRAHAYGSLSSKSLCSPAPLKKAQTGITAITLISPQMTQAFIHAPTQSRPARTRQTTQTRISCKQYDQATCTYRRHRAVRKPLGMLAA